MSPITPSEDPNPNEDPWTPPPDPPPPVLGFDLLAVKHNMREAIAEAFSRRGELIAGATGIRMFDDHAGVSLPSRSFQWTATDRTDANEIRTFLDARKGRLVPFWVPTCARDLVLKSQVAALSTTMDIRRCGFLANYWPQPSRHYLAFWSSAGLVTRKITDASVLDATTERLTLEAAPGVFLPLGTTISFLVLCRLAADLTEIRWFSTWGCEVAIRFVELPAEVTI